MPKRWTKVLTVRRNRAAILAGSLLKFIDERFTGAVLGIKLSCRRFARRSYGFLYLASDFYGSPGATRVVNSDRLKMMNATVLICFRCLLLTENERRHETIADKRII